MLSTHALDHQTYRVCRLVPNACHDGDQDVLFDGEGTRIDRNTKNLDLWHDTSPQPHQRERDQLGNDLKASHSVGEIYKGVYCGDLHR